MRPGVLTMILGGIFASAGLLGSGCDVTGGKTGSARPPADSGIHVVSSTSPPLCLAPCNTLDAPDSVAFAPQQLGVNQRP